VLVKLHPGRTGCVEIFFLNFYTCKFRPSRSAAQIDSDEAPRLTMQTTLSLGGFERLHVADGERAQTLEWQRSDFSDIGCLGDRGRKSGSNQNLSVLGSLA
jgi:hypothetical protein